MRWVLRPLVKKTRLVFTPAPEPVNAPPGRLMMHQRSHSSSSLRVFGAVWANIVVKVSLQIHCANMGQKVHSFDGCEFLNYREWKRAKIIGIEECKVQASWVKTGNYMVDDHIGFARK